MKTAFVVDSTAGLKEELLEHKDIRVVQLKATFANGDFFTDLMKDHKTIEFYERMEQEDQLPTTSQPELGHIENVVVELIDQEYDSIIFIAVSDALSGTLQTMKMTGQNFDDKIDSYFVDSKTTSFILEDLLIQGLEMIDHGATAKEVEGNLQWVADHSLTYVVIEHLDNLVKGGRLSKGGRLVGNLLNIKPILVINEEGEVHLHEKVRTSKRAYRHLVKLLEEANQKYHGNVNLFIAHGNAYPAAEAIENMIKESMPENKLRTGLLTPIIGTHGGAGALGVAYVPQFKNIRPFD